MKKIKTIVETCVCLLMLICAVCINASASSLPAQKAWFDNNEGVFSLDQKGNLYFGESIYSQNKELLLKNVKSVSTARYYTHALLFSGDVVKIDYDGYDYNNHNNIRNNLIYFEDINARELLGIYKSSFLFINNNDDLILYDYDIGATKIYDNVNDACFVGDPSYYESYAIILSNDNKLILYDDRIIDGDDDSWYETGTLTTIMEGVVDFNYYNNYGSVLCALSVTDDLYYFNIGERDLMPIKIAASVKTIFDGYSYFIPYIHNNDYLFFYDMKYQRRIYLQFGVKDVFSSDHSCFIVEDDDDLYVLDDLDVKNNGNWYYLNAERLHNNFKDLIYSYDRDHFFNNANNELYVLHETTTDFEISPLGLSNIEQVQCNLGIDNDCLFISDTGCVYGAKYEYEEIEGLVHTIYCQKPLKLLFNGKEITLELKVQNVNNRTMYPFRECLENFGATVIWDSVSNCAVGKLNGKTIEFPIGKEEYYINGVRHEMDTATYIDNSIGRTYIPIRYAAEGLGFTVDWIEGDTEDIISIYE